MKYETDEFKYTVTNIPAPEFDIDKAMQGHNRYVRKKKHYERLSVLLITFLACVVFGSTAYAAAAINNQIKTNKRGVTIGDGDNKTKENQTIIYDENKVSFSNDNIISDSIEDNNMGIIYDADADYYNLKKYYADGSSKEAFHSFDEAKRERSINIAEINPSPGEYAKAMNIFVDSVTGINEYEVFAQFFYDGNGRICNVEYIKGGTGIRVSNTTDVIYEKIIQNDNAAIVYQRTEEEGAGGKAYISTNDFIIVLEYYEFSDSEIEAYLKALDLKDFI